MNSLGGTVFLMWMIAMVLFMGWLTSDARVQYMMGKTPVIDIQDEDGCYRGMDWYPRSMCR